MDQPKLLIYSYSFALIDANLHNLRVDPILFNVHPAQTCLINDFIAKTRLARLVSQIG